MFLKVPKDILARENQQQGSLGKNRARAEHSTNRAQVELGLELDWRHIAETNN